uniref:N-acetyltransferase domain-containing protein n=1 Tax=Paulinella chromatophora TaxID=39717 RepID=B1X4Q1_PAUCH|nr:hypothetical protein PCC_0483 [Paulinella chromatophora]ACB42920.1 hypothetical protein PCC_0483 [Paulinella chromatophora]
MKIVENTRSIESKVTLICHCGGATGMCLLGLGPSFYPTRSLWKLQRLLDQHSSWAIGRSKLKLKLKLDASVVSVSAWYGSKLVGFGRASSDGVFRAVLWDILVSTHWQGKGIGKQIVKKLLTSPSLENVEKVYLMTTKSGGFYQQLGFKYADTQKMLFLSKD